jgi:hypothetical protein
MAVTLLRNPGNQGVRAYRPSGQISDTPAALFLFKPRDGGNDTPSGSSGKTKPQAQSLRQQQ